MKTHPAHRNGERILPATDSGSIPEPPESAPEPLCTEGVENAGSRREPDPAVPQDNDATAVMTDVRDRLAALESELQRLQLDSAVLAELHQDYRKLREQFHEREVLGPLFRGLIAIADRCRQELAVACGRFTRFDQLPAAEGGALTATLSARRADLVEIEALLATYDVTPFHQPGPVFESATQRCVDRIRTTTPSRRHQIARRLLPGYRRGTVVLRPEHVSVYVTE